MNPSIQLQEIFQAEISRLHNRAINGPLDAADIAKLERLVSAYSKYQEKNFKDNDTLAELPTDELMRQLKDGETRGD